jgi:hypothetical protein
MSTTQPHVGVSGKRRGPPPLLEHGHGPQPEGDLQNVQQHRQINAVRKGGLLRGAQLSPAEQPSLQRSIPPSFAGGA